jgi:hypothetical protein
LLNQFRSLSFKNLDLNFSIQINFKSFRFEKFSKSLLEIYQFESSLKLLVLNLKPWIRFKNYFYRLLFSIFDFCPVFQPTIRPTRPLDAPAGPGQPTITSFPSSRQAVEPPATGRSATAPRAIVGHHHPHARTTLNRCAA